MRYKRRTTLIPAKRRNFKINAFGGYKTGIAENLIDLSESKYCYNYVSRDGELVQGTGTAKAEIKFPGGETYVLPQPTQNVKGVYFYPKYDESKNARVDRIIVQGEDNALYSLCVGEKSGSYVRIECDIGEIYSAVRYRFSDDDCMIIASEKGLFTLCDTAVTKINDAPSVVDICIHNERAFACVKGEGVTLWFSDSLNPEDWSVSADAGGYVTFANFGGALKKLVSFGGYLYVFREYGIERVYAYGEQSEFAVRTVYSSTDRIFENTVAVCGNVMMFLSEKGLHVFDGLNDTTLSGIVECSDYERQGMHAKAVYYRGVYYLGLYLKSLDSNEGRYVEDYVHNNTILSYDTLSGRVDIMADYDVKSFCTLAMESTSALFVCLEPELQTARSRLLSMDFDQCTRCGKPATMYWRTGMTDLGYPEKKKTLKSVNLTVEKDVTVGIMLDGEVYEYEVLSSVQKTINVNRKFKKFGLYFRTIGVEQRIGNPVITVDMR